MRKLYTLFILLLLLIFLVLIFPKEVISTKEPSKPQTKPETLEVIVPIVIEAKITAEEYVFVYVSQPVKPYTGMSLGAAAIKFLGNCESGNNPTTNTGNGYYGAFQFTIGTWNAMGTGYARADLAPYDVQVAAVHKLLSQSDIFGQFPDCAIQMRNEGLI